MNRVMTGIDLSEEDIRELDIAERQLLELCQIYRLPMFASVVTFNDEAWTGYRNITYSAGAHQIVLKQDWIREHLLIANHFDVGTIREGRAWKMKALPQTPILLKEAAEEQVRKGAARVIDQAADKQTAAFVSVVLCNDAQKTEYVTLFTGNTLHLMDDQIQRHLQITQGMYAAIPRNIATVDVRALWKGAQNGNA